MRSTLSALVVAAGLLGFGAAAQATPLSAALPLGASVGDSGIVQVQLSPGERRMVRRHRAERRMMRRHRAERRMMRHERRMYRRGY